MVAGVAAGWLAGGRAGWRAGAGWRGKGTLDWRPSLQRCPRLALLFCAVATTGRSSRMPAVSAPPRTPCTGPTADVVRRAKQEIKRILEESTEKAMRREAPAAGRYSIM